MTSKCKIQDIKKYLSLKYEVCGVIDLDDDCLFRKLNEGNINKNYCAGEKYFQASRYGYIWHTHQNGAASFPSREDLLASLRPEIKLQIIFTSWGVWTIHCNDKQKKLYYNDFLSKKQNIMKKALEKNENITDYKATMQAKIPFEYFLFQMEKYMFRMTQANEEWKDEYMKHINSYIFKHKDFVTIYFNKWEKIKKISDISDLIYKPRLISFKNFKKKEEQKRKEEERNKREEEERNKREEEERKKREEEERKKKLIEMKQKKKRKFSQLREKAKRRRTEEENN